MIKLTLNKVASLFVVISFAFIRNAFSLLPFDVSRDRLISSAILVFIENLDLKFSLKRLKNEIEMNHLKKNLI
jgi:hypothetical protein